MACCVLIANIGALVVISTLVSWITLIGFRKQEKYGFGSFVN
jgi:hypothetical protein